MFPGDELGSRSFVKRRTELIRFLVGLILGIILSVEAFVLSGAGHGTYAPFVFTASAAILVPVVGLFAGPLVWAVYFLLIPNLPRSLTQLVALSLVALAHFVPAFWVAYEDPAFNRADTGVLMIFGGTGLLTIGCLLFFCLRHRTPDPKS